MINCQERNYTSLSIWYAAGIPNRCNSDSPSINQNKCSCCSRSFPCIWNENISLIMHRSLRQANNILFVPFCWNSMSVFTKPTTRARGRAWSQASLLISCGIALKTLLSKFSFAKIAADIPLCPSKTCQSRIPYEYHNHCGNKLTLHLITEKCNKEKHFVGRQKRGKKPIHTKHWTI